VFLENIILKNSVRILITFK